MTSEEEDYDPRDPVVIAPVEPPAPQPVRRLRLPVVAVAAACVVLVSGVGLVVLTGRQEPSAAPVAAWQGTVTPAPPMSVIPPITVTPTPEEARTVTTTATVTGPTATKVRRVYVRIPARTLVQPTTVTPPAVTVRSTSTVRTTATRTLPRVTRTRTVTRTVVRTVTMWVD